MLSQLCARTSVAGSSAAVVVGMIGTRSSVIEKAGFALILMRTRCGYRPAAICNPEAARENAAVYTDDADEYANNIKIIG